MRNVFIIAASTYKQTIRDRILYGIVFFALLFLGSAVVIGSLSLGEDTFVIKSFGLAGIYMFGLVITIFLGSSIVYDEVEKKTTYMLLTKPVKRADIIIGKFLGLLTSIGLITLFMTLVYGIVVWYGGGGFNYAVLWSVLLQFLEVGVLISLLILFSIITTPLAATIYTIVLVYIGHSTGLLLGFALKSSGFTKYALTGTYYLLPNLEKFNVRNIVVHNITISPYEIGLALGYAVIYGTLALCMAITLFNRKDL